MTLPPWNFRYNELIGSIVDAWQYHHTTPEYVTELEEAIAFLRLHGGGQYGYDEQLQEPMLIVAEYVLKTLKARPS